jgi:hypothetical protein
VPAVVFPIQYQISIAFDVDGGDIIDLVILEEFLADLRFCLGPGLLVRWRKTSPAPPMMARANTRRINCLRFILRQCVCVYKLPGQSR